MARHRDLIGAAAVHPAAYFSATDPGAVGANKFWIDTDTGRLYYRNDTDTGWLTDTTDIYAVANVLAFTGDVNIVALSATNIPLTVKAASSQTADLTEWLKSGGSVYARMRAPGQEGGYLHIVDSFTTAPVSDHVGAFYAQVTAKGTATTSGQKRTLGFRAAVSDAAGVVTKALAAGTGAANNGSGLIRITTAATHGFTTGDQIAVYGVGGTTEANGAWIVTVINTTTFDLQGSTYTNAYTSGGYATNRPMMSGLHVAMGVAVDRGSLTGTALHGDDVAGVTVQNVGAGKGTDAFYVAASNSVPGGGGIGGGNGWDTGFTVDSNVTYAFRLGAHTVTYGLDMGLAQILTGAIRLPNNSPIRAFNASASEVDIWKFSANNYVEFSQPIVIPNNTSFYAKNASGTETAMFKYDTGNRIAFQTQILFGAGVSVQLSTVTGTQWGTAATHKQAWWGKAAVVQPTTAITGATFVANSGVALSDASTFDGYTIAKVVAALRQIGLLA